MTLQSQYPPSFRRLHPATPFMKPTPLPHISRPREEAALRAFLLDRLQPRAGIPKALVLCGRAGVGKRSLVRRVYGSDPRFRAYRVIDAATREVLDVLAPAGPGKTLARGAEALGQVLSVWSPPLGLAYGVAHVFARDRVFGARAPDPAGVDLSFLEQLGEPVLAVVPRLDPRDVDALRLYARLVREAHDRSVPLALLFLDDAVRFHPAGPGTDGGAVREEYDGLTSLQRFLGDDGQMEALPLRAFSEAQCREAFASWGLSADWARVAHHLSDGGPAELSALWGALQRSGIIEPAGGGRWKARPSAAAGAGWTLVRDRLTELLQPRMPKDTVHEGRLVTACLLAASMGSSFLPQSVAECIAADPKRDEFEREAWEDLWYEVLEHADPEHPALAAPLTAGGRPEILQADGRQCFVYAFRDSTLVNLLRGAARQMWREWSPGSGERRPHESFVRASRALEAWLDHHFQETWPHALPFRAALLRVQHRDWEASPLEDLAYRLRLRDELQEQLERERRQVAEGEEAEGLYACLLWYADVLEALGQYEPEAGALVEAKELADSGRVTHPERQRLGLLSRLGGALLHQGRYQQAEPVLADTLRRSTELFGSDHLETLSAANNLASLHHTNGRYDRAEPLYHWALSGRERRLGADHLATLVVANNLGLLYRSWGKYDEAEPLLRRALEGRERSLGPDHPDTLFSVNDLALLYRSRGRYGEAEPLYRRALKGRERALGPDHPSTLVVVNNLGSLCYSLGRFDEAEPLFRRAMEMRERVLGREHPDTLSSVNNLATLCHDLGRFDEAGPLYQRALEASERLLGPDHSITSVVRRNLAALLRDQGRAEDEGTGTAPE